MDYRPRRARLCPTQGPQRYPPLWLWERAFRRVTVMTRDAESVAPFTAYAALLGRRVVVTLDHGAPDGTGVVVAEGTLLAFDDGGSTVLEDEMGFVHYCWPMLDIKPAHIDGPVGSTADEASARRAARSPEYRAKRAERHAETVTDGDTFDELRRDA